jgi:hypothetical protein
MDTDRIVGVVAMLVGLGSLFIVVYQTQLMRQAQNASALPYLMLSLASNEQGVFLVLRNTGVGPALIEDVQVRRPSGAFRGDPFDFFVAQRPDADQDGHVEVNKVLPGRLIPASEGLQILGAGSGASTADQIVAMRRDLLVLFEIAEVPRSWYASIESQPQGRAVVEIVYSSVYGDRWRLRSDRLVPDKL